LASITKAQYIRIVVGKDHRGPDSPADHRLDMAGRSLAHCTDPTEGDVIGHGRAAPQHGLDQPDQDLC
jgi:hypothetical protein